MKSLCVDSSLLPCKQQKWTPESFDVSKFVVIMAHIM